MNKILRGLLVFSIVASLVLGCVPAMADETLYYTAELSDYVRTFDESESLSSYLYELGAASSGHFQSLYKDDGNMVLKLGDESNEPVKLYNSGGSVWVGTKTSGVKLGFKVKRNGEKGAFCVYDTNKAVFFTMRDGNFYLFGKDVAAYDVDTWYDVKLELDFSVGYAALSVKKSTDSQWTTVSSAAEETFNTTRTITKDWKAMPSKIGEIIFSHDRDGKDSRPVTYIDDLVIDEGVNSEDWRSFLDDSFSQGINVVEDSTKEMTDSTASWLASGSVSTGADDSAVLTVPAGTQGAGISKKPFYSAPSVRQRIRFKLSAPTAGGEATVSASFNNPASQNTYLPLENAQGMALLKIGEDKIVLGDEQYDVSLSESFLYECEIVYVQREKVAKIALTDSNGKQYTGSAKAGLSAVFGADSDWGNLSEFVLSLESDNENSASVSFDDFDWDMGFNSSASASLAEGQSSDNAPLDTTILFTFGETVDSAEAVGINASSPGSASLEVLEEGEATEVPYTLEWISEGVLRCTFAKLGTEKSYSVSLTGVTLLSEEETQALNVSFTTTEEEVTAAEPEFSNGTLSIDVSTGYAEGTWLTFIGIIYDADDDTLIDEVKIVEQIVGRGQQTLTISGLNGAGKVGALLWSDFYTQVPYIEKKVFDVE